jgi:hypothetical protein
MQINFFGKTIQELNTQIELAKLDNNKDLLNVLINLKRTFVEETKDFAKNNKFLIGTQNIEGSMELIEDEGFTVKEIDNLVIIQPLEVLSLEQIETFVDTLSQNKDCFPDKNVVVVPYDVKVMTATLMTRLTEKPKE